MNPYKSYMYSYPHKTAYRPLSHIFFKDYTHWLSEGHDLYLHIPFCESKCGYCNLFSVTGQSDETMSRYLDAVERQSLKYRDILSSFRPKCQDITIGGGTPLLLSETQLERVLLLFDTYFGHESGRKLTVETAPNQTTPEKLGILKQAQATRVSIGIQSFHDSELTLLGRRHSAKTALDALTRIKSYDFPCVNVDFIYGIPGQDIKSLLASLKEALSFEPDEIFLYPLYLNHGAWLKWEKTKAFHPDLTYRQYQEASAFLKSEGYRQDSMRRFVRAVRLPPQTPPRPFEECGFRASLALGCGGRSYLGNLHFCTPYAVTQADCLTQLKHFLKTKDFSQITHGILLSEDEMKRRFVIRHLLIRPGLPLASYQKQFGSHAIEDFPLLQGWMDQGYAALTVSHNADYLSLTETGLSLSDFLGPQLISPQIREKMKEWEVTHGRKNDSLPGQLKKL